MGLSTHVLDTALGRPAGGVRLELAEERGDGWELIGTGVTDADGRCREFFGEASRKKFLGAGTFRIRFDTAGYYRAQQVSGLYPFVDIVFSVRDAAEHYHIPLLLTANGYTTYRGS